MVDRAAIGRADRPLDQALTVRRGHHGDLFGVEALPQLSATTSRRCGRPASRLLGRALALSNRLRRGDGEEAASVRSARSPVGERRVERAAWRRATS
jgi:hypothetical protein